VRDFSGTAALVADEVGISKNRCWFRSAVAAWVEPRVAGTRRFGGVLGVFVAVEQGVGWEERV